MKYISVQDQLPQPGVPVLTLVDSTCDYPEFIEVIGHIYPDKRSGKPKWFLNDKLLQKYKIQPFYWCPVPAHPKREVK